MRRLSLLDVEATLEIARGVNPARPGRRVLEAAFAGLGKALETYDAARGPWPVWRDRAVEHAVAGAYSRARAGVTHAEIAEP